MDTILKITQIVISVLLIISILLQNKGAGLSGVFGGEGNVYKTKRGAEKTLHMATIVLTILFFSISAANLFLSQPQ